MLVFHRNLTCFRAYQPVERLKLAMEKIMLKWTEGKSKRGTSVVKRSAIKSGAIAVGNNDPCDVFLDPSALLHTKFAFWFPAFSTRIRTEDPCPTTRKIRVGLHNYPWILARNNHGIPWKKLSFSVSCTYRTYVWTYNTVCYHEQVNTLPVLTVSVRIEKQ